MISRSSSPGRDILRLCRRLLPYATRRWTAVAGVLAVTLVNTGVAVINPWPMKVLVDNVLHGHPFPAPVDRWVSWLPGATAPSGLLIWTLSAFVALFLLTWAVGVANTYASIGLGQRLFYDLAGDLFAHLQRLSLRFHVRRSTGDLIRRVTNDCTCVQTIVKDAVLPVFGAVITLASVLIIMLQMDAVLTGAALLAVPLMVLALHRYATPMYEREYERQEAEGRLYTVVEGTLSAISVVQAFGAEPRADARLRAVSNEALAKGIASTDVQLRFKVLIGLATALGTAGILWLGVQHVLDGRLTVGSILVFIAYLGSLYTPLQTLMYSSSTITGAAASASRVMEVLDMTPDVRSAPNALPLRVVTGHVRVEGVTFGYESDRDILHDVTLEARPGQTVAIVGSTGAGKSTFVGLIPRFFDPASGRVLVDGHDVRYVDLADLRRNVSLVLQESFLFPISIRDNIAYGRPDATQQELEDAARAANIHAFIESLPAGYDTVVGERGATLSGGERQRVSIARALLKNAPILILDEPSSALDAHTEALLLEAIDRLMVGRTTFIIAHRLSTIRNADLIAVFDHGRIIETGTHDGLLAAQGKYAAMHARHARSSTAVGASQ